MKKLQETTINRNETLDTVKAVLILLVIIGHLLSAQSPLSFLLHKIIYSFHIPLFLGISGYLIKRSLMSLSLSEIINKYFFRMAIPFLVAFIVFSILNMSLNLLYPYYHLWFIPAFLLMILYTYIIEKLNIHRLAILLASSLFTVAWLSFYNPGDGKEIAYYFGDKRFYYDFIYFYFGYMLRNYPTLIRFNFWLYVFFLLLTTYTIFFLHLSLPGFLYSVSSLFFNLSLIFLVITLSLKSTNIRIPIFTALGSYTLPIYLWHILPLLLMIKIKNTYHIDGITYFSLYFLFLAILIYVIVKFKETFITKVFFTGTYK
jgi:fucose 4-O-acetylase-like acetyltransferase